MGRIVSRHGLVEIDGNTISGEGNGQSQGQSVQVVHENISYRCRTWESVEKWRNKFCIGIPKLRDVVGLGISQSAP